MKPGIVASASLHALLLGWGLVSFSAPDPFEVSEPASLPVDLVSVEEFSQAVAGDTSAPLAETPAPTPTEKPQTLPMPAENVGDNEADLATPPTPQSRPEEVRQASAEAAPPPTPEPPQPQPEPQPAPEPEPTPVPEPVAEQPPEPPAPQPEPQPEPPPQEVAAQPEEPALPTNVPVPVSRPRPPEPVKVAEAKPEPERPKPEAPKPEKPKPEKPAEAAKPKPETPKEEAKPAETPKPRQEATRAAERESRGETESDFNADEIAALLDRSKASGGGAKRSEAPAAAGASRTTGAKLTRGEMDALSQQLGGCWSVPPGVEDAASLTVVLRFSVDGSGRLNGQPQITETSGNRAFDESAKRAVQKCDRQEGLKLPMDKVEQFADYVEVGFNPSAMF